MALVALVVAAGRLNQIMNTVPFDNDTLEVMDKIIEAGDAINGIPSGVDGARPGPTGDSLPSGPIPKSSGAPNPNGIGGKANPKSASIPTSKFSQGKQVPEIKVDPIKHPDNHSHDDKCAAEGDHVVTAEYCLEQMARVLMELAENQEDPAWVEAHRTLAEQWMGAAQMLLQFRIDANANAGETELKQQQLHQQNELHQQTLAQNDTMHAQTLSQNDQNHAQGIKQKDEQHKAGLQQVDQQHKLKMDSASKHEKLKLDTASQSAKTQLQAKKQQSTIKPLAKPSPPTNKPGF